MAVVELYTPSKYDMPHIILAAAAVHESWTCFYTHRFETLRADIWRNTLSEPSRVINSHEKINDLTSQLNALLSPCLPGTPKGIGITSAALVQCAKSNLIKRSRPFSSLRRSKSAVNLSSSFAQITR